MKDRISWKSTNFSTASTSYVDLDGGWVLIDSTDYSPGTELYFVVKLSNTNAGAINYFELYEDDVSSVSGSETSFVNVGAGTKENFKGTIRFSPNTGFKPYKIRVKTSAGTLTVDKCEVIKV